MWIDSEDLSLYVLLPHLITSHTITLSKANVCIVLYKQHNALWGNLHIGHTKEEVRRDCESEVGGGGGRCYRPLTFVYLMYV